MEAAGVMEPGSHVVTEGALELVVEVGLGQVSSLVGGRDDSGDASRDGGCGEMGMDVLVLIVMRRVERRMELVEAGEGREMVVAVGTQ